MTKPSKADVWMPLYIADYARDTFHLTRDQHGGYLLLLMACWGAGGRLPNDRAQLASIAKATPREWSRLAQVLLPFFKTRGEWLIHKRVLAERNKADKLIETRRQNGRLGGRPRTETKPVAKLQGNLDETPARVTVLTTSESRTDLSRSSEDIGSDSQGFGAGEVIPLAGRTPR